MDAPSRCVATATDTESVAVRVVDNQAQAVGIEDAHVTLFDFHQAFLDEFGEGSADRLKLQAEEAANFIARHAQNQFGLGKTTCVQALHQVEQERGQTLFGAVPLNPALKQPREWVYRSQFKVTGRPELALVCEAGHLRGCQ